MKTSLLTLLTITLAIPAFAGPPPYVPPYLGAAGAAAASNWNHRCILTVPDITLKPLELIPHPIAVPMPAPARPRAIHTR